MSANQYKRTTNFIEKNCPPCVYTETAECLGEALDREIKWVRNLDKTIESVELTKDGKV